jgi:lysozyme
MKISQLGLLALEQREGRRLKAYPDSRGLWTIGVGHLTNAYFRVFPGQQITEEQVLKLLAHDVQSVEDTINVCVHRPLTQYQFDALVSLGYNIGVGGLSHSAVVHFINAGDFKSAAEAFMNWVHPAVLVNRRKGEMAQFLGHTKGTWI